MLDDKLEKLLEKYQSYILGAYDISYEPEPLTPAEVVGEIKVLFDVKGLYAIWNKEKLSSVFTLES